ncbi:FAD-dependent oxidoreductase [Bifidobacterium pullorum]|uniref:FAD-dependent oxidoreductase n=1 Tax=Bifidobacterium pullorum TaxID=78448 RepID=UPI000529D216|nr:FAD-dependent oxidoreductase [Bifidobacterium pullorum]
MTKRIRPMALAIWIVFLLVIPTTPVILLHATMDAFFAPLLPRVDAGVLSYAWMLLAVYLSTRPHWLDRLIGLPAIYMMHGVLGMAALVLAIVHRIDLPAYGSAKLTGEVGFWTLLALVIVALITMAGWLSSRIPAVAALRRLIERVVSREGSVWLHRLLLIAVITVGIHMNLVWYIAENTVFITVTNICAVAIIGWYVISKLRERFGAAHGTVLSVTALSGDTMQVEMVVPSMGDGWLEGDFVFLRFPSIRGMRSMHPFSMVNRPNAAGLMTFAIRADGDFTRLVSTALSPGTSVEVVGPYGRYRRFIDGHNRRSSSRQCVESRSIVVYAGGIGITPLLPVIQYADELGYDIVVLYSARASEGLLYHDDILQWAARTGNRMQLRVGRFSEREFADAMRQGALYVIGGPESMRRDITHMLIRHGVRAVDICYESFVW